MKRTRRRWQRPPDLGVRAAELERLNNELRQVAESTLTAIMGRMSAFTGKAVTWEQALESKLDTFPKDLAWDAKIPGPTLPKPGSTPLV